MPFQHLAVLLQHLAVLCMCTHYVCLIYFIQVSVPVEDGVFQCSNVFDAVFSALGNSMDPDIYCF